MTEQELHEYNKWLTEVWNPNQLHIPFMEEAPKAFLEYRADKKFYCYEQIQYENERCEKQCTDCIRYQLHGD